MDDSDSDNHDKIINTTKNVTYGLLIFFGIIVFVLVLCVIYAYFTQKPVSMVILKSAKSIDDAGEKLWQSVFG